MRPEAWAVDMHHYLDEGTGDLHEHQPAALTAARQRGQEYLLEHRLLRRRSTGDVIARGDVVG